MHSKIEHASIKITDENRKKLYLNGGPCLTTLHARAEISIVGEIRNLEVIGDGINQNNDFLRILKSTKTFVFTPEHGYVPLKESKTITFEYGLTFIRIIYEDPRFEATIIKTIIPGGKETSGFGAFIEIQKNKKTNNNTKVYIAMQTTYTLGDNYYNNGMYMYGWAINNGMNNTLFGNFACLPMDDDMPTTYIQTSKGSWKMRSKDAKEPILENATQGKRNEETVFIIQRCLTPEEHSSALFVIGGGKNQGDAGDAMDFFSELWEEETFEQYLETLKKDAEKFYFIQTPDTLFNQYAAISAKIAATYFKIRDTEFTVPGHQYPRFYARDSHWQFKGMLFLGFFDEVKSLITQFFNAQRENGSFPTSINLDGTMNQFTSSDADLDGVILPVLSLIDYIQWSQDWSAAKYYWENIKKSYHYLLTRDKNKNGLLEQDGNQDWADTLRRSGNVAYSQAIYYKMLKEISALAKKLGEDSLASGCQEIMKKMQSSFETIFWDEERQIYDDFVKENGERRQCANQDMLLAHIFGLTENKERINNVLGTLKAKCWSEWGAGKQEPYDQSGSVWGPAGFYHNGGIWLWCASFEAASRFLMGDTEKALWIINTSRAYDFGKNPYNYVYFDTTEWYGTYNGLNDYHHYKSAKFFTTGAGAHLWSIVIGMLGTEITEEGDLTLNPKLPDEWKNNTKVQLKIGKNERIFEM